MRLTPRFVGRLGVADAVTVTNAGIGFLAAALAPSNPRLAAQLILLAGVGDGLDGVLARRYGSSAAGPYLDSLADVAAFAVAPAVLVTTLLERPVAAADPTLDAVLAFGVPALFVVVAVVRLGLYTAYDTADDYTIGAPSTLAATVVSAATLAGYAEPALLLGVLGAFCYLMVSPIRYPDLLARDALIMGAVHVMAIVAPEALGRSFPVALLTLALAYLVFGPRFYWGERERRRAPNGTPVRDA